MEMKNKLMSSRDYSHMADWVERKNRAYLESSNKQYYERVKVEDYEKGEIDFISEIDAAVGEYLISLGVIAIVIMFILFLSQV